MRWLLSRALTLVLLVLALLGAVVGWHRLEEDSWWGLASFLVAALWLWRGIERVVEHQKEDSE